MKNKSAQSALKAAAVGIAALVLLSLFGVIDWSSRPGIAEPGSNLEPNLTVPENPVNDEGVDE